MRFDGQLKQERPASWMRLRNLLIGLLGTKKSQLKNTTINRVLEMVRTIFNYAVTRRYLPYSPMASIKLLPVYEQQFDYWSREEVLQFLTCAANKYQLEQRWIYVL